MMMVIRTFVAVLISEDLRARITGVQEQIRRLAPDVKWVAPELFHVTLKFLGDVREDALPQVFSAVEEAVARHEPFDLSAAEVGAFPSASKARIIWVGIDKGKDQLRALAASVDDALAQLGYPREEKGFKPHITIGRVRENTWLPREFFVGFEEIDASDLGSQQVASVAVMRSELQREGPVYSPMSENKLG